MMIYILYTFILILSYVQYFIFVCEKCSNFSKITKTENSNINININLVEYFKYLLFSDQKPLYAKEIASFFIKFDRLVIRQWNGKSLCGSIDCNNVNSFFGWWNEWNWLWGSSYQ